MPLEARTWGHVHCKDILDVFADAVCDKLGKGVTYLVNLADNEPPLKKKRTMTGATADITAKQE